MGFSTSVSDSTVRIKKNNHKQTLETLKDACIKHMVVAAYIEDLEAFKETDNLVRLFEMLRMECEVDGEDILGIGFAGGKTDLSEYIWPMIEKLVEPGASLTSRLESGETETISFDEGGAEYDYDEPEVSEDASDFFDAMDDGKLSAEDLDTIIQKEGSINFTDYSQASALIRACRSYRWAIEQYADAINEAESDEEESEIEEYRSALAIHEHNIDLILSKNPDLNMQDEDGTTALSLALESKNIDFIEKLFAKGAQANLHCLIAAAVSFDIDILDMVANKGLSARESDVLIHVSATASFEVNKMAMIRHLLDHHGCDVNRPAIDEVTSEGYLRRGSTPIMAAALTDDYELLKYLIEKGANLHARDKYLNTALHYCSGQTWIGGDCRCAWFAREENAEVIALLLESGANPLAENAAGYTCLDLAEKEKNEIAIKLYASF